MKRFSIACVVAVVASLLATVPAAAQGDEGDDAGAVVVANRGSGTISVIDPSTAGLVGTFALPSTGKGAEPMYVTTTSGGERVFVGDRANDRVVVFDPGDWSVIGTVPTGAGIFHMWNGPRDRQLWVNNDIDATSTVIDPRRLNVITTVPMPADLVAAGYVPHDVILDPTGRFAYVTLLGGTEHDWVVQFSTHTFEEVDRAPVGLDPHVSVTATNRHLYVPAQNSSVVHVLDRLTLETVTLLDVPGAHGATISPDGSVFYTTNLPGGGTDGLWAIDTATNTVLGSIDTAHTVPHNVVATAGDTLFLTHSGAAADKVTVYDVSSPVPVAVGEVTVGLNPFGLTYVP